MPDSESKLAATLKVVHKGSKCPALSRSHSSWFGSSDAAMPHRFNYIYRGENQCVGKTCTCCGLTLVWND